MTAPLLEGTQLTKVFGGLAAVSKVDFDVRSGEIVGLIGPNGAGKTTLFNLISGTLPVTRGTIQFGGRNITRESIPGRCRDGIARTFQTGMLFRTLTVLENVEVAALFGKPGRHPRNSAKGVASELLDLVGLADKKGIPAKGLTLGAQRRLEIARALATRPSLILLDEVLAGLTPTEVDQGVDLIRRIRSMGVTVLMVEHIMKAIMGLSDRVIVLHHGEKIAEGPPETVATSKVVKEVYLGEEE